MQDNEEKIKKRQEIVAGPLQEKLRNLQEKIIVSHSCHENMHHDCCMWCILLLRLLYLSCLRVSCTMNRATWNKHPSLLFDAAMDTSHQNSTSLSENLCLCRTLPLVNMWLVISSALEIWDCLSNFQPSYQASWTVSIVPCQPALVQHQVLCAHESDAYGCIWLLVAILLPLKRLAAQHATSTRAKFTHTASYGTLVRGRV